MDNIKVEIIRLLTPFLVPIDAFLVDLHIVSGTKRKIVLVFIDTDLGITIDQCAEISRSLGAAIDFHRIFECPYVLQVSSPGLEKPLRMLRQYRKNIGREYKVRYRNGNLIDDITGKLTAMNDELLTFIKNDGKRIDIPFKEIIETIEKLPW
jgi:ribosome maturation factor RimP